MLQSGINNFLSVYQVFFVCDGLDSHVRQHFSLMRCFHSEIFSKLHHLSDKYILNFGTLPLQAIDSTIFLKLNLNILIESDQQKIIKIVLAHVWTEPNCVLMNCVLTPAESPL